MGSSPLTDGTALRPPIATNLMNLKTNRTSLVVLAFALVFTMPLHAAENADELAKKIANPVASMISLPLQNNFDFGIGAHDGWRYTLNVQPVIPFELNEEWNLITRTIIPYVHQEDVFKGRAPTFEQLLDRVPVKVTGAQKRDLRRAYDKATAGAPGHVQDGLSDIVQSFFFAPRKPLPGGWIAGVGPVFLYPSATNDLLGTEKWGAGPTAVMLRQSGHWTYGALANHIWSYAGNDSRADVSATFFNPFVSYRPGKGKSIGLQSEMTYDWVANQWSVPLSVSFSKVAKFGSQAVSFGLGAKYVVTGPGGGPEWGLRAGITLLFPK